MLRLSLCPLFVCCCVVNAAEPRLDIARQPMPLKLQAPSAPVLSQDAGAALPPMPSSDAGADFGEQVVLVRHATWEPWRASVGVQGWFTDNVALAPNRAQDWFMKTDVSVGYSNRLSGPWSVELALEQDFIRYDEFRSLDFDLTRADAGLAYEAAWLGGASLFTRYHFYHLMEAGFDDALLTSHALSAGVQKSWQVGTGQQLALALMSEPSLATDPETATRHEHAVLVAWSVRLTDKLGAQVSGRAGYHVSPEAGREDWNFVGAISAAYALTPWANVGVTGSMAWNESDRALFTYRNVMAGVFVGVQLNF